MVFVQYMVYVSYISNSKSKGGSIYTLNTYYRWLMAECQIPIIPTLGSSSRTVCTQLLDNIKNSKKNDIGPINFFLGLYCNDLFRLI